MKNVRHRISEIIASAYILLFVYAALSKVRNVETFRIQLDQSVLLTHYSWLIWWGVPLAEIIIAILLVMPKTRLPGLYLAFGLMILFTGYIFAITRYTRNVPCSCGGILESMTWNEHLIFNVVFVIAGGIAIMFYPFSYVGLSEGLTEQRTRSGTTSDRTQY